MEEYAALEASCRRILERGDLAAKLAPLRLVAPWPASAVGGAPAALHPPPGPGPVLHPDRPRVPGPVLQPHHPPARGPGLRMGAGAPPLPRPSALHRAEARAECLARFAHHELQAVELFAWALLRWPELPADLRRGLAAVLADEQRHAAAYLGRLYSLGFGFEDFAPHSDYLWKHLPRLEQPASFFAGMGLTLEQANLDFTLLYRDGFRAAGDEASARICQAVHDDEITHVGFAAWALARLDPEPDEVARYEAAVRFPLSAARAKGRRFQPRPRERAGLGAAFVEHVRRARSSQERAGARR